jgi:hypothetical protein
VLAVVGAVASADTVLSNHSSPRNVLVDDRIDFIASHDWRGSCSLYSEKGHSGGSEERLGEHVEECEFQKLRSLKAVFGCGKSKKGW